MIRAPASYILDTKILYIRWNYSETADIVVALLRVYHEGCNHGQITMDVSSN